MSDQYQQAPEVVDLEFHRSAADTFYRMGSIARGINPARIERIQTEIDFTDLVDDLTGRRGEKISCPFHGRDSTPSFFTRGGFGFCFGCPPGQQYYDQIRFVQKFNDISWFQALRWIEKEYELPPLPEYASEEEIEDEITTEVFLVDLEEEYFRKAAKDSLQHLDPGLAEEYALIYFNAREQDEGANEARKAGEHEEASRMKNKATTMLARVLGQQVVNQILDDKEARNEKLWRV